MWKQASDVRMKVITFARRLEKLEQTAKDQRRELRELSALVQRLAFEVRRNKDQQQYAAEREASERKMFMLQVENMILKANRQLPPSPSASLESKDEE